ncbi:MAG: elongation factor P [Actinomycetota bacterium]
MISTNQFKIGMSIELDGTLFEILDFQHVKPGKGQAFVRTRLKNLKTDSVTDKTFRAGEKVKLAHLEKRKMQYLYRDEDNFVFMDTSTYEQLSLTKEHVGVAVKYLKENVEVEVEFYEKRPVGLELPVSVELKVVQTTPGLKGDTVSGGSKPATLETGVVVQVPLFINVGDAIKIDTRTGGYITRV